MVIRPEHRDTHGHTVPSRFDTVFVQDSHSTAIHGNNGEFSNSVLEDRSSHVLIGIQVTRLRRFALSSKSHPRLSQTCSHLQPPSCLILHTWNGFPSISHPGQQQLYVQGIKISTPWLPVCCNHSHREDQVQRPSTPPFRSSCTP